MDATRTEPRKTAIRLFAWMLFALLPLAASATELERQRQLFNDVYAAVERGNWSAIERLDDAEQSLLRRYVLWPDLRASWFRARVRSADHGEIERFLDQFGELRPARELRYRYALHLAKAGYFADYLAIYRQHYDGRGNATLDCLALRAEIEAGSRETVTERAKVLWSVGRSQVDECDPVFEHLYDNSLLSQDDYRRRFELAIDAREFSMARWLGKSIDQQHIDTAGYWLQAARNPETFVRKHRNQTDNESTRAQLAYAIERLTYRDPSLALKLWNDFAPWPDFSKDQTDQVSRHIALWMARDNLAGAHEQLVALTVEARDAEVLRWQARSSLRAQEWEALLTDIAAMPENEREAGEWRYWRGIALAKSGREEEGQATLEMLARERSFYGFLAADELGQPYALEESAIEADEITIAALAARPELVRARELFLVGQDSRGRSEWEAVVSRLGKDGKAQAAVLAKRWGWHSRAIAAAAAGGKLDALTLRYPLPYDRAFEKHSAAANIPSTWAYGVARSESLFMRDVRSSAGAIGLMQLMPATGRRVARSIKLPYSGLATLTDADSNIRLGTTYLADMQKRFGGNRVLATAAYNAGPHRVDEWLDGVAPVDTRIWIETIPFNETRSYVRRVFEAETIFHWRMTGEMRRLSDELVVLRAPSGARVEATKIAAASVE
jgi:soluble lytic murein transglycosylase